MITVLNRAVHELPLPVSGSGGLHSGSSRTAPTDFLLGRFANRPPLFLKYTDMAHFQGKRPLLLELNQQAHGAD